MDGPNKARHALPVTLALLLLVPVATADHQPPGPCSSESTPPAVGAVLYLLVNTQGGRVDLYQETNDEAGLQTHDCVNEANQVVEPDLHIEGVHYLDMGTETCRLRDQYGPQASPPWQVCPQDPGPSPQQWTMEQYVKAGGLRDDTQAAASDFANRVIAATGEIGGGTGSIGTDFINALGAATATLAQATATGATESAAAVTDAATGAAGEAQVFVDAVVLAVTSLIDEGAGHTQQAGTEAGGAVVTFATGAGGAAVALAASTGTATAAHALATGGQTTVAITAIQSAAGDMVSVTSGAAGDLVAASQTNTGDLVAAAQGHVTMYEDASITMLGAYGSQTGANLATFLTALGTDPPEDAVVDFADDQADTTRNRAQDQEDATNTLADQAGTSAATFSDDQAAAADAAQAALDGALDTFGTTTGNAVDAFATDQADATGDFITFRAEEAQLLAGLLQNDVDQLGSDLDAAIATYPADMEGSLTSAAERADAATGDLAQTTPPYIEGAVDRVGDAGADMAEAGAAFADAAGTALNTLFDDLGSFAPSGIQEFLSAVSRAAVVLVEDIQDAFNEFGS